MSPGRRWRRAETWLLLVAQVLLVVGVIVPLQAYRIDGSESSWLPTALTGALLLAVEAWLTRRIELRPPDGEGRPRPLSAGVAMGALGRGLVVLLALGLFVEFPAQLAPHEPGFHLRGVLPHVWALPRRAFDAQPLAGSLLLLLWLALVHAVVVRRHRLRGLLVLVLPPVLLWTLVQVDYRGWLPSRGGSAPGDQPGVDLVLDAGTISDPALRRVWRHSRTLLLDPQTQAAFVAFGRSFGTAGDILGTPNLWRVDLRDGTWQLRRMNQVRMLAGRRHDLPLMAFPWHLGHILRYDKASFAPLPPLGFDGRWARVDEEINPGVELAHLLFVPTNLHPTLHRVDMQAARVDASLSLSTEDLLPEGSLCCHLSADTASRTLFALGVRARGGVLIELDADKLEVSRTVALDWLPQWLVIGGRSSQWIYISSEFAGGIYRVDRQTLRPQPLCSYSSGTKLAWDARASRLLLLEPYRGRLTVADEDCRPLWSVDVGARPGHVEVTDDGYYVSSAAGLLRVHREPPGPAR